jgi:hypothetical protein
MKRHFPTLIGSMALGAGLLLASATASAGVNFSVGISAPLGGGARIGTVISTGHPGAYVKRAPVYRPAPVVYAPAPVVYAPPPVYGPPPVYVPAPVVYSPPVVYRPAPVVYRPAPVYRPRVVYSPVVVRPGHPHRHHDEPQMRGRGPDRPVAVADRGRYN